MSEVKVFRVVGEIRKPNLRTIFRKEVRALKPEHAIEQVYAELGSRHRVKRPHIRILEVKEISPDEITDPIVRTLTLEEVKLVK